MNVWHEFCFEVVAMGSESKEVQAGRYLVVLLNSFHPMATSIRIPIEGAHRVNLSRGSARAARHDVSRAGQRSCHVFLMDDTMSSSQASLFWGPDGDYWLNDSGSKNGTTLNGRRIEEATRLNDGDVLGVGVTFVLFRSASEVTSRPLKTAKMSLNPLFADQLEALEKAARSENSVLITGLEGSGRRRLARTVHQLSRRRGMFVEISARTFAEEVPAFREAEGGTLYVRDLDELPDALIPTLMRAVSNQRRLVSDFGSEKSVRLISSGPPGIEREVPEAVLRIVGHHVTALPPLRERREDIGLWVSRTLGRCKAPEGLIFRRSVAQRLVMHPWPGQVAELETAVAHLALLAKEGGVVRREHLRTVFGEVGLEEE